jgi:putative CocE/NonD family hydrolase
MSRLVCGLVLVIALSSPAYAEQGIKRMFDVRSAMRDGVELSSDIWLPEDAEKHPLILLRTPYMRTDPRFQYPTLARFFVEHGYAVAVQDVRGRGDSDGHFGFFFQEANDGYDTVEWMAAQPWSNGRVCTMGLSYLGTVQWLMARTKPPHLVCIAPTAAAGDYLNEIPYIGGAWMQKWALNLANSVAGVINQNSIPDQDWAPILAHRPLLTADEVMGRKMPQYRDWLQHPTLDAYWKRLVLTAQDFRNIDLPALHVTGWFDADQPGAMYYWRGMAESSPAADDQYLIVGPWDHVQTFSGGQKTQGEMQLTADSIINMLQVHLEFFDRYLKQTTERFAHPRVKLYVTGRNEWREFKAYPVPGAQTTRLYLSSRGKANSLDGDGKLLASKGVQEAQDRYDFDPKNPVPLEFGPTGLVFAVDRRAVERRGDVLVYTGEPLQKALEIIGRVGVELYAASDARDTDFTASIVDVYPDGRAVVLGQRVVGIIRARYRNGLEQTELLTPGKVERYQIDLGHIGHAFEPGHRIRVEISSSAAPMYNPNQNTGNPVATDTEWRTAHQTIYHDAHRASALVLPVVSD